MLNERFPLLSDLICSPIHALLDVIEQFRKTTARPIGGKPRGGGRRDKTRAPTNESNGIATLAAVTPLAGKNDEGPAPMLGFDIASDIAVHR